MIDVSEPSDSLVALCALSTERDLHYLRRLGRSVARCVDLYWARDGKVRHRALVRDTARVRSLIDEVNGEFKGPPPPASGMLAFIEIMDEAQQSGYMPPRSMVLLARRTVQNDRWALLYLVVYGIVTDNATLVDQLFQIAEDDTAESTKLADKPVLLDAHVGVNAAHSGMSVDDDGDVDKALVVAADEYNALVAATQLKEQQQQEEVEEDEEEKLILDNDVDGEASDLFYHWWQELRVSGSHVLRPYFHHLYPTRCDIRFEGGAEDVSRMTLADHLVFFAAAWKSSNVAQLLVSVPEIRRNLRTSIFFAVCEKMTDTLSKSARSLSTAVADDLEKLLTPTGVKRLKNAFNNPCSSVEEHFRHLGHDAAYVDAVSRYVDPASRATVTERQMDLIRQFLRRVDVTATKSKDDDNDNVAAPAPDVNVSLAVKEVVDYNAVFWYACQTNNIALVKEMVVKQRVDTALSDDLGLRFAVQHNSRDVLLYLLALPQPANPAVLKNWPICVAVDVGAKECLIELLRTQLVDAAANDDYPLRRASERNDAFAVSLLMSFKTVNPNVSGAAPLLNAVRWANAGMVEEFLDTDKHRRLDRKKYLPRAIEQAEKQLAALTDEANANSALHDIIRLMKTALAAD
jgi:hypothetical protein